MEEKIKVLILEDVLEDLELVVFELQQAEIKFTHLHVETEEEFKKGLIEFKPDLILSDYNLPHFTGMEALRITKEISPLTPFIIITGSLNEEIAVECIKAGAIDYVLKDNLLRLSPSITQALEKKALIEAKMQAEIALRERMKELNCFFEISNLVQTPGISDDDFFKGVVDVIHPAFRNPEITVCRLMLNEKEYKTRNFKKTNWNICEDIIVDKRISGSIEVCLLKKISDLDSTQFLKEEKDLIKAIAERLGQVIGHKKAVKELIESEQKMRSIMENSADAIFITDENGNYTYTNKEVTALLGFTKEEMKSKTIIDMAPQQRINEYLEIFKSLKTEGKLLSEIELLKNDGTYIQTDLNAVILPDGNVYGSCRDITERKKMENELKDSEIRYHNLFENSSEFLFTLDLKGNFTDVNKAAEILTGFTKSELLTKNFLDYTPQKDHKKLRRTFLNIYKTGQILYNYPVEAFMKDGSIKYFETSFSLLKKGEQIIGFQGSSKDITERKQAEEQIQQDLRVKTALLQELYHRTKNNMQMVISILNRYSRASDNEFIQTTFREMGDRIKSMSKVHQHLYNAQDLSNINLKKYIIDLVGLQAQSHSILNHEVSIKYDLEDVFLGIDLAIPLGLILTELISNVFKHAFPENKKGKLFIGLSKAENNIIDLKITDNGIGIPADLDLRNSSSTGLTLMFMLAEQQMKGEVNYRSENGLKWQIKVKENLHKTRV